MEFYFFLLFLHLLPSLLIFLQQVQSFFLGNLYFLLELLLPLLFIVICKVFVEPINF